MSVPIPTYVEAISYLLPTIDVYCVGDATVYENIIWSGGDPLPAKADLDLLLIDKTRVRQWKAIQDMRDSLKVGGVKVGTDWFHSDDFSRIQQIGLVMFGTNMPTGIMWKTMAGGFVQMTPTLAMQIFTAQAMHDMSLFAVAEQKRQAMIASADPANYDQTAGWPATFTG